MRAAARRAGARIVAVGQIAKRTATCIYELDQVPAFVAVRMEGAVVTVSCVGNRAPPAAPRADAARADWIGALMLGEQVGVVIDDLKDHERPRNLGARPPVHRRGEGARSLDVRALVERLRRALSQGWIGDLAGPMSLAPPLAADAWEHGKPVAQRGAREGG